MAPHNLVAVAQRQLFRLILGVAALHGPAVADELESIGVEGGFFLFSEQEASWTQSTLEGARTSLRLGYGIETPQLNVALKLAQGSSMAHEYRQPPTGASELKQLVEEHHLRSMANMHPH